VYENKKEGFHILKINALTATGERHQTLINGLASGIGELRAKAGLPPQKKIKFARGSSSGGRMVLTLSIDRGLPSHP
jgi:hypothetical protein